MEPITLIIICGLALVTGTATTTYFVTKNIYSDEHERLKAHINNQLIINQEKDNAHEFSQTIFMVLLAIVTSAIAVYIGLKCAINAILSRRRPTPVLALPHPQPQQQVEFQA